MEQSRQNHKEKCGRERDKYKRRNSKQLRSHFIQFEDLNQNQLPKSIDQFPNIKSPTIRYKPNSNLMIKQYINSITSKYETIDINQDMEKSIGVSSFIKAKLSPDRLPEYMHSYSTLLQLDSEENENMDRYRNFTHHQSIHSNKVIPSINYRRKKMSISHRYHDTRIPLSKYEYTSEYKNLEIKEKLSHTADKVLEEDYMSKKPVEITIPNIKQNNKEALSESLEVSFDQTDFNPNNDSSISEIRKETEIELEKSEIISEEILTEISLSKSIINPDKNNKVRGIQDNSLAKLIGIRPLKIHGIEQESPIRMKQRLSLGDMTIEDDSILNLKSERGRGEVEKQEGDQNMSYGRRTIFSKKEDKILIQNGSRQKGCNMGNIVNIGNTSKSHIHTHRNMDVNVNVDEAVKKYGKYNNMDKTRRETAEGLNIRLKIQTERGTERTDGSYNITNSQITPIHTNTHKILQPKSKPTSSIPPIDFYRIKYPNLVSPRYNNHTHTNNSQKNNLPISLKGILNSNKYISVSIPTKQGNNLDNIHGRNVDEGRLGGEFRGFNKLEDVGVPLKSMEKPLSTIPNWLRKRGLINHSLSKRIDHKSRNYDLCTT